MKKILGFAVVAVAGFLVLKFVFGAIWTAVKLGAVVLAVGGLIYAGRRWRQRALSASAPSTSRIDRR